MQWSMGLKGNDENRRVSTNPPKRRNYFLEETIFQVGGVVEYRDPEQLASASDTEGFNTADRGLT